MFSAPSLPNRDQYDKLVRLRDERMERQKQEEKQRKIAASLLEMEVSTSRRSAPLKEAMAAGGQRKYGKIASSRVLQYFYNEISHKLTVDAGKEREKVSCLCTCICYPIVNHVKSISKA